MFASRSMTAGFLLVCGGLLLVLQFAPAASHALNTAGASCHEESGPAMDPAPPEHDCCMVGHLHDILFVSSLGLACRDLSG